MGLRPDKAAELLAIRMERQKLHEKSDPPWLFLLIKHSVLRDLPESVRVDQCKRLLDLIQEPKLSIQIVPAGAPVFVPAGFQILSFSHGRDVAYLEGAKGHGQMLSDADDVHGLAVLFNVIRSAALPVEETESLIRSAMEGL